MVKSDYTGLRVAVVGAHGTGKTTLAERLVEITGLPLITEAAREVIVQYGDPLKLDTNGRKRFQRAVLDVQIYHELENYERGFISDRSVIDNLAYWVHQGLVDTPAFYKAIDRAKQHLRRHPYDLIIYLPVEFDVVNDGVRWTCEQCRHLLSYCTLVFLKMYTTCPIVHITGDLETRVRKAMDVITRWRDAA